MTSRRLFNRGSATSEAAADYIEPHRASQAKRIFDHLKTRAPGGLTCAEIEAALGLKHQSASARFNDLANAGCIKLVGAQRGTPPSEVYVVVPGATFKRFRAWQHGNKPSKNAREAEKRLLNAARSFVAAHELKSLAGAIEELHDAAWAAGGGDGDRPRRVR